MDHLVADRLENRLTPNRNDDGAGPRGRRPGRNRSIGRRGYYPNAIVPRKPRRKTGRWRAVCPAKKSKPRGSEQELREALKHLGPFTCESEADAKRAGLLTKTLDPGNRGMAEEFARELITSIAVEFNSAEYVADHAPRYGNVVSELEALKQPIEDLTNRLEVLSDIGALWLQRPAENSLFPEARRLYARARGAGLPRYSNEETERPHSAWVTTLHALRSYVDLALWFAERHRVLSLNKAGDAGGRTNLFIEEYGTPRWGLVYDCLRVYEEFKPGKARTTQLGAFHRFVLDVYEFATGKSGIDHAQVDGWLKPVLNSYKALPKTQREFEKAQAAVERFERKYRQEQFTDELGKRYETLVRREIQCSHELDMVSRKLWPGWRRFSPRKEPHS